MDAVAWFAVYLLPAAGLHWFQLPGSPHLCGYAYHIHLYLYRGYLHTTRCRFTPPRGFAFCHTLCLPHYPYLLPPLYGLPAFWTAVRAVLPLPHAAAHTFIYCLGGSGFYWVYAHALHTYYLLDATRLSSTPAFPTQFWFTLPTVAWFAFTAAHTVLQLHLPHFYGLQFGSVHAHLRVTARTFGTTTRAGCLPALHTVAGSTRFYLHCHLPLPRLTQLPYVPLYLPRLQFTVVCYGSCTTVLPALLPVATLFIPHLRYTMPTGWTTLPLHVAYTYLLPVLVYYTTGSTLAWTHPMLHTRLLHTCGSHGSSSRVTLPPTVLSAVPLSTTPTRWLPTHYQFWFRLYTAAGFWLDTYLYG